MGRNSTENKRPRPVISQRVSSLLKSTRQEQGISLGSVSDATKISLTTLQCIESGDFAGLSSPAYAKGFIRSYARFLGVDTEKAINLYLKEAHPQSRSNLKDEGPELSNGQKLIKFAGNERSTYILLGGLAFIILGALILGQLRALFAPPSLSITSPIEVNAEYSGNLTIIEDSFVIEGVTAPQTIVRLNGEALALNPDLTFSSSTIPLGDKGATARLTATNQFGRESVINLHITKGATAYSATDDKLIMIMEIKTEATVVQIATDGIEAFNERAFPGDVIALEASNTITLTTSNPEYLIITINGKKITDLTGEQTWEMANFR